jgi:hypothetical protein
MASDVCSEKRPSRYRKQYLFVEMAAPLENGAAKKSRKNKKKTGKRVARVKTIQNACGKEGPPSTLAVFMMFWRF